MMQEFTDKAGLVEYDDLDQQNAVSSSSHVINDHTDFGQTFRTEPSNAPGSEIATMPKKGPKWHWCDGLSLLIMGLIAVAVSITLALAIHVITGDRQVMPHGVVVSSDLQCSRVGRDLLQESSRHFSPTANAFDAVIATYICLTVTRPDLVSLGGDCGAVLYHAHGQYASSTPPQVATMLMNGFCDSPERITSNWLPQSQGLESVGLPRFLLQLYRLHKQHGLSKWEDLFQGALKVAKDGFPASPELVRHVNASGSHFYPSVATSAWRSYGTSSSGATVKPPDVYVKYLEMLSKNGSATQDPQFVVQSTLNWSKNDLAFMQREITANASESDLIKSTFGDYWIVGAPLPSVSGSLVTSVLHALSMEDSSIVTLPISTFYTRLVNLLALAQTRLTLWNVATTSPADFIEKVKSQWMSWRQNVTTVLPSPDATVLLSSLDSGGGAVIAVDNERNYVSLSATLGAPFGSGEVDPSTGVIFNNALSSFSSHGVNSPAPHKQPWTAGIAPLVVFNSKRKCGARIVMASSGVGLQTASALVQTVVNTLKLTRTQCATVSAAKAVDCVSLTEALDSPRLYGDWLARNSTAATFHVLVERNMTQVVQDSLKQLPVGFSVSVDEGLEQVARVMVAGKTGTQWITAGDVRRDPETRPVDF